jgi:hypothetical protein
MQAVRHSSAYVMQLHGTWRVIVPIRGRLSPQVLAPGFATRAAASEWLGSAEGQSVIDLERTQRRPIRPAQPTAPALAQTQISSASDGRCGPASARWWHGADEVRWG